MRVTLVLVCLALFGALGWHAATLGTVHRRALGAPQIQALVDTDARAKLEAAQITGIKVEADGRNIVLTGAVAGEVERARALQVVAGTRLVSKITDRLMVLETASPFVLSVVKKADGTIRMDGHVPSRAVEEALLSHARTLTTGAIGTGLKLAAGTPDGDWAGMARTAITVLSSLDEGTATLSDDTVTIFGKAPDNETLAAASAQIRSAPMGKWNNEIEGALPIARPYAFSATKTSDGMILIAGNAPDEATQSSLLDQAAAVGELPQQSTLDIAGGMPDPDWPARVADALVALGQLNSGLLTVEDNAISLVGDVDTDPDLAALSPLLDENWTNEITVLDPTPAGDVTFTLARDGSLRGTGRLPEGLQADMLVAALPGLTFQDTNPDKPGKAADWAPALEGLNIVIPRFQTASIHILGKSISVTGTLRRGFSSEGSHAALRAVLGRDWSLTHDIAESAPLAEVVLGKDDQGISLGGVLPRGMSPDTALGLLGEEASGEGLTGGGDGNADPWAQTLTAVAEGLGLFKTASGRIGEETVELNGVLRPGYGADEVKDWFAERMPAGWNTGISPTETAPSEGDRRTSLATNETEHFQRGYWLPVVDFPATRDRCQQETGELLGREKVRFVTGSARIDREGRAILNRLAAIAVRCVNSSSMTIVIAGHTDSVGNDDANLRLSQERAEAVLSELTRRGVRAEAMTAVGFGEAEPIATNNNAEGRAQNRRITFSWSDSDG